MSRKISMNIAISLNNKYANYAYVLLTSIFENNKDENITIYALNCDLNAQNIDLLSSLCNKYNNTFNPIIVETSLLSHLPTTHMWSREAYLRLALIDIIPSSIERILYLDIDMIVLGSLSELYNSNFEDKYFCVCKEFDNNSDVAERIIQLFDGDINKARNYFNSGMMLWNISKLRENNHYNLSYYIDLSYKLRDKLVAVDQDILNYAHSGQTTFLDKNKWDLYARTAYFSGMNLDDIKDSTKIIHYIGDKPWLSKNYHFDIEYLWWEYAMKTSLYETLSKEFIHSTFIEHYAITTARNLESKAVELKKRLDESININKMLLEKLNPKNNNYAKISIIIPCYNQSKYIRPCLDSIYSQTYPQELLEIILVDDASTDDTPRILKEYELAHETNTLLVLCPENSAGFAGKVRNIGLSYASGDYVAFIDSDDIVSPEYIEKLYQAISSNLADVAACNYSLLDSSGNLVVANDKVAHLYDMNTSLGRKTLYMQEGTHGYVMCKLYRKTFLDMYGIKYSESAHVSEDTFFHGQVLLNCQKYVVINERLYQYRINENSLWNSKKVTDYIYDCYQIQLALCELYSHFQIEEFREELEWNIMAAMLSVKNKCIENQNYDLFSNSYKEILSKIKEYYPDIENNHYINKTPELQALLFLEES